jgi:hypothetical protein
MIPRDAARAVVSRSDSATKRRREEVVNSLQRHILDFLEEDVKNRAAVIDGIERGLARHRVGDRDTTEETLVEYNARVSEAKELIAKLKAESR